MPICNTMQRSDAWCLCVCVCVCVCVLCVCVCVCVCVWVGGWVTSSKWRQRSTWSLKGQLQLASHGEFCTFLVTWWITHRWWTGQFSIASIDGGNRDRDHHRTCHVGTLSPGPSFPHTPGPILGRLLYGQPSDALQPPVRDQGNLSVQREASPLTNFQGPGF